MNSSFEPNRMESGVQQSAPARLSAALIEDWLVEKIAGLLNTDTTAIDPEVPFDNYGLDSADAIGLTGELEDFLQRRISPTLLYDYPTVVALAEYLGNSSDSITTG